jgi:hypothetical protein
MITHIAKLPCGFTAEFRWDSSSIHVEWTPDVPGRDAFRSARHRAKVLRAYTAERDAFLQMVALELGGVIATVDVGKQTATVAITRPPTRQ